MSTRKPTFRVAGTPCREDWDEMARGPSGVRRCAACANDVVDLTALTRRQAEAAVLRARAGAERACIRVVHDAEGEPVFVPEPRQPSRLGAPGLVLAAALGVGAVGCGREAPLLPASAATLAPLGPPVLPAAPEPLPTPAPTPTLVTVTPEPIEPPVRNRRKHRPAAASAPQPPQHQYIFMGLEG
jgi:hypothetical protein